jgi:hypothetical protein
MRVEAQIRSVLFRVRAESRDVGYVSDVIPELDGDLLYGPVTADSERNLASGEVIRLGPGYE